MDFMNEHTRESLDFDYIMKGLEPLTPYGMEKKRELMPFKIGEEYLLQREYDRIEVIAEKLSEYRDEFRRLEGVFKGVKEIRGSLKRAMDGKVLDEVEFFELKNFVLSAGDVSSLQEKIGGIPEELRIERMAGLEEFLDPEGQGGRTFYIYDSYSEELWKIRSDIRILQGRLETERRRIFSEIEKFLGVKPKLNGEITLLKNDSERLRVARNCPYLIEGASTVLSITFRLGHTDELNGLEKEIENLKLLEEREEYRVRMTLSEEVRLRVPEIMGTVLKLSTFDLLIAKARFALLIQGVRPALNNEVSISVRDGRHIRLQEVLKKKDKFFFPVTFTANKGVTVITGANMGGKTVNLKVAGMLTLMAQYGLFVPALEFKTCLFDYIYFSVGDRQSIDSGLSTFGSEICGMGEMLNKSSKRGLILIDELARGTNPSEGYAISRAMARYLKNSEAVTLFTTHFDGITQEEGIAHLQVRGLKRVDPGLLLVENKGDSSQIEALLEHMDYTLERVEGSQRVPRDAINIARLMGLDKIIIKWAEEILEEGREG